MMDLINMKLLPMKAHYFLFNAGTAPIVPFLPIYARQLGFSSLVVGLIYTLLPIMGMIAKPTMGAIADRFKCQKLLFQSSMILTLISFFAIIFVPAVPSESSVEVHCHEETFIKICSSKAFSSSVVDKVIAENTNNASNTVQLTCNSNPTLFCNSWNIEEHCSEDKSPSSIVFQAKLLPYYTLKESNCLFIRMSSVQFTDHTWHVPYCNTSLQKVPCNMLHSSAALTEVTSEESLLTIALTIITKYQFWMLTALLVLSWVGMAVVVSIGDAICFSLLGDYPSQYGKQRLWGAIGWGVFSIMAGYLVDAFSRGHVYKNYTPIFYLMAVMLFFNFIVSFQIKCENNEHAPSILKDIGKLFADVRIVVFMVWCILVGMCTALIWNFLFWYLEDLARDSGSATEDWIKTLEGLIMGIQCFGGELPFFFLSGWILKRIGHVNAMSLVLLSFGIRFLLYSTLTDPWWCLPIELFQGVTFSILYATMASYASIVAPPGTENTVQGLVGAVFEGCGVSLGSLIGGILFSNMSGAMVFRISGLVALLACVLHVTVQLFLKQRRVAVVTDNKGPKYQELETLNHS